MTQPRRPRTRRALRVLISAGPTREPVDAVRFISNYSTGYMGAVLTAEALRRGHRVTVVHGPITESLPEGARVVPVERAQEMEQALRALAPRADVIIMAAAVADFRPVRRVAAKWPRQGSRSLALSATPDIVRRLPRRADQLVVGFGVESTQVLARARRKLQAKRLDLLLAQRVSSRKALVGRRTNGHGSPFGRHRVSAWLLGRQGSVTSLGTVPKTAVARALLDKIEALCYGQVTYAR